MSEALNNRAAVIRQDLKRAGVKKDPCADLPVRRRLRAGGRPCGCGSIRVSAPRPMTAVTGDLSAVLRELSEKLGLDVATEDNRQPRTPSSGSRPRGVGSSHSTGRYLLADFTWRDAATGW